MRFQQIDIADEASNTASHLSHNDVSIMGKRYKFAYMKIARWFIES